MENQILINKQDRTVRKIIQQPSPVYGIGMVGALIYFIKTATGFWVGVLGILKAVIWPAMLVYKILEFLKV